MRMTILGGGNIGTLMAAEMAAKEHIVTIFTSAPDRWAKCIEVYDREGNLVKEGDLNCVTDNLEEAVLGADIIWITYPAFMFKNIADKLIKIVKPGQVIGIIPGSGNIEQDFSELIEKNITIFGFQRVHSIARVKEYGHSVYMLGRKSQLQIAAIPNSAAEKVCMYCEKLFDMECIELPNYLTITLTPSNSVLHTTRLYCLFKDWNSSKEYDRKILFYEEWDDESSKLLLDCDDELMLLCD